MIYLVTTQKQLFNSEKIEKLFIEGKCIGYISEKIKSFVVINNKVHFFPINFDRWAKNYNENISTPNWIVKWSLSIGGVLMLIYTIINYWEYLNDYSKLLLIFLLQNTKLNFFIFIAKKIHTHT